MDINNISIKEKIAQLVMPRIDFNDPNSLPLARKLVKEYRVGGFIIFGGTSNEVSAAAEELQALSQAPLFFGCDAERGVGQILGDATLFPYTMSLGAIGDPKLVYEQGSLIAQEMKQCGLNLVFGPVSDVNTNPDNPIINIRSYGDSPALVSELSGAFIRGLQDSCVMACAKHFPGHGGTGVDSHLDMPVSDQSEEELFKCDLIPFKNAVESGVSFIMPAHIAYPKISGVNIPATVSKDLISGLLRDKLDFRGLIVSDSFRMEGIGKSGSEADTSALSIMSGCDVILDPKEPEVLINRLTETAESGGLDAAVIDEAHTRILDVKDKWLTKEQPESKNFEETAYTLINKIAERSVCLIKGGPIKSDNALVYTFDVAESGKEISSEFIATLSKSGINSQNHYVTEADTQSITELSKGFGAVICIIFTSVGAYKKPPFLSEHFKSLLHGIEALPNEKILVSFGSPYVVSEFDGFDTVLSLFDTMDECQRAAAGVLSGRLEATGKLPVNMQYPQPKIV